MEFSPPAEAKRYNNVLYTKLIDSFCVFEVVANSVDEVVELLNASGLDLLPERDDTGKNARDLAETDEMRAAIGVYDQLLLLVISIYGQSAITGDFHIWSICYHW